MTCVLQTSFLAATLLHTASATLHHLYVGNLVLPASIHLLDFDDKALTLVKAKTFLADSSHAWIAFDHLKQNIYGASLDDSKIASYSVDSSLNLRLDSSIIPNGDCLNTTSAFVLSNNLPPYTVYTVSWSGPAACGMSIQVHPNGTLSNNTKNFKYYTPGMAGEPGGAIHGLAQGKHIYSADLNGDHIWTHQIMPDGTLDYVYHAYEYSLPKGMHPRHIAAHPNWAKIYVVMEGTNEVLPFDIDTRPCCTGWLPTSLPYPSGWSLIPDRNKTNDYWSAEVQLSPSNKLLWATARAKSGSNNTGYITLFNLDDNGNMLNQIFQVPTTTTGGIANAVIPASWSDEFMAMTDFPRGYVQVWQLVKGNGTSGAWTGVKMVAHVDIADGGCCANAIWYD